VTLTENPSIPTIQAHVLIAMYLLAASRRNAAFMCLGLAVRAAYAIGLHRQDVSALYPASECVTRERLWTATRTLDLFTSSCLGRPPSTSETRDMSAKQTYSATNDLNLIFETILTQVYAKRMISTETLEKISDHHRRWAARFTGGLEVDGISPDVKSTPNLGLLNMKQSYYWSIMLVSQPFLIERATSHAALFGQSGPPRQGALSNLHRNDLLAHACVDSAIQSINLLRPLMNGAPTPKRLPMVINSIFASSLVLGLALFANLDQSFPLMQSLEAAKDALRLFSQHDAMTRRHLDIVESLSVACQTYSDTWTRQRMEGYHQRINGVFGSVHPSTAPTGGAAFPSQEQSYHGTTYGQSQAAAQGDTSNESFEPPQDSENANVFASLEGGEQEFLSRALSDISPKTLWFDAFDVSMSLLPTVDPSTLGLE
jgi:hypothetical protein